MRWIRWSNPVVIVILTLLSASLLVIYLQRRALLALERQTSLILEKISEQSARRIAEDIGLTLEGPVFDTLTAVNHPDLRAARLDLIAEHYEDGLAKYSHVERFFVWNESTQRTVPGEVLFFGPAPDGLPTTGRRQERSARTAAAVPGDFVRDPELGAYVFRTARTQAESQQIYAAFDARFGGKTYNIFVRIFYTDAARDEFFALLGYVVCLDSFPGRLFPELYRRKLAGQLESGTGGPRLAMQIRDDHGQTVFGPEGPIPGIHGEASFSALFYPADQIRTRLAAAMPPREWTVVVGPVSTDPTAKLFGSQGYWLSGLSVLLMLVALIFAVQGQKRASQLAHMQGEFVSHVSHQLKTPLSLIAAVTETLALERVRSPDKLAQYLEIMRSEVARLSGLLDRILELSCVDRGRRYEFETVPLATLVRETTELFAQKTVEAGHSISVSDTGEAFVSADPAALEQVLLSLLDNAVKYSNGRNEIAVRVGRSGVSAVIEVQDLGIGIKAADQARIFERFYRGSEAAARQPGFGLGLAIVQEIVTAHRGRIDVESAPGRGSTFRVRLPLLRDQVAAAGAAYPRPAGAVDESWDNTIATGTSQSKSV